MHSKFDNGLKFICTLDDNEYTMSRTSEANTPTHSKYCLQGITHLLMNYITTLRKTKELIYNNIKLMECSLSYVKCKKMYSKEVTLISLPHYTPLCFQIGVKSEGESVFFNYFCNWIIVWCVLGEINSMKHVKLVQNPNKSQMHYSWTKYTRLTFTTINKLIILSCNYIATRKYKYQVSLLCYIIVMK